MESDEMKIQRGRKKSTLTCLIKSVNRFVEEENLEKIKEQTARLAKAFEEFEEIHEKYFQQLKEDADIETVNSPLQCISYVLLHLFGGPKMGQRNVAIRSPTNRCISGLLDDLNRVCINQRQYVIYNVQSIIYVTNLFIICFI